MIPEIKILCPNGACRVSGSMGIIDLLDSPYCSSCKSRDRRGVVVRGVKLKADLLGWIGLIDSASIRDLIVLQEKLWRRAMRQRSIKGDELFGGILVEGALRAVTRIIDRKRRSNDT